VAIRNERREAIDHLKKAEKSGTITEDELKHSEKEVQTLTDRYVKRIDDHLQAKEKEIMTV
jgi:ribosome recycling factor